MAAFLDVNAAWAGQILKFSRKLAAQNVLAAGIDAEQMRFVTHNDVSRGDCVKVLEVAKAICR